MNTRRIGQAEVSALGLGCMNLSHAYGTPPAPEAAEALLLRALDLGVTHFDTAALYGFGSNETLLGSVLSPHRNRLFLASKCGMTGIDGRRVIDGRPEVLKQTCEAALKRLRTDHIDLYYLHRWDKQVPIEESIGALSRLVEAGKIVGIGLSEVSTDTLRRAHAEHPISALQNRLCKRELRSLRQGTAAPLFLKEGSRAQTIGSVFRQPALAKTLQRLALMGVEDFYHGQLAKNIHNDMRKNDGLLPQDDLAQVPQPLERKPVSCNFEGLRVITYPPPGAGRTNGAEPHIGE